METSSIAGGGARLDTNRVDEEDIVRYQLQYRLVDLEGREIATIYPDEALKELDVVNLGGHRWRVCSLVGACARITRLARR